MLFPFVNTLPHSSVKMSDSLKELFINACYAGEVEKMTACLTLGVNIDCVDKNGETGLMKCAAYNDCDAMEILLNNQPPANINFKTTTNHTALHCACGNNATRAVTMLCAVPGVQLNIVNSAGDTPLLLAVANGHIECIKAMENVPGVEWNVKDRDGNSAIMEALKTNRRDIVTVMLKFVGVDLDTKDADNNTLEQVARLVSEGGVKFKNCV